MKYLAGYFVSLALVSSNHALADHIPVTSKYIGFYEGASLSECEAAGKKGVQISYETGQYGGDTTVIRWLHAERIYELQLMPDPKIFMDGLLTCLYWPLSETKSP